MSTLDNDLLNTMTPEELEAINGTEHSPEDLAAMQRLADQADDGEVDDDDDDGDADGGSDLSGSVSGAEHTPGSESGSESGGTGATNSDASLGDDAGEIEAPTDASIQYTAKLPDDYQDKIKDLDTRQEDLKARFRSGDIDLDEYELERDKIARDREDLIVTRAKAEISQDMTAQSAQAAWRNTVNRFVSSTAKEDGGIDYRKDTAKAEDLDQFVKFLANKPEHADKPPEWFLQEAHRRVKALHGIADKATKQEAIKEAADKRKPPIDKLPRNLADVPGADGPGDVTGEFEDVLALEGTDFEDAIARMSPAQREKFSRGR